MTGCTHCHGRRNVKRHCTQTHMDLHESTASGHPLHVPTTPHRTPHNPYVGVCAGPDSHGKCRYTQRIQILCNPDRCECSMVQAHPRCVRCLRHIPVEASSLRRLSRDTFQCNAVCANVQKSKEIIICRVPAEDHSDPTLRSKAS